MSYSKSLGLLSLSLNYRLAFPALPGLLETQPSVWLFASTSGTLCRKKKEAGFALNALIDSNGLTKSNYNFTDGEAEVTEVICLLSYKMAQPSAIVIALHFLESCSSQPM